MAKETTTVVRSDLSGEIVPDSDLVRIRIEYIGKRKKKILELDASESEVTELIRSAKTVTRHRTRGSRT